MYDNVYSVSQVNKLIKTLVEGERRFANIQVRGEISNFKRYSSGHCYFTLKDAGGVLKAVMFKTAARTLRFEPQNGDTVIAVGRISVYERDGVYQLYTDLMIPEGTGDLMLAFEQLKQKLLNEGLFDESRKKQLPVNPKTVGIITSPSGAAVRDLITVSRRRNKGIKLLLYPVRVQGKEAPAEIAHAIEFMNRNKMADVLIVGRGGGSIEELWAFNEEQTVRAVAASEIPVVSAVGHETDFTLTDFAADKRAATPSQAAEIVVADANTYLNSVAELEKRLKKYGLKNGLPYRKLRLNACKIHGRYQILSACSKAECKDLILLRYGLSRFLMLPLRRNSTAAACWQLSSTRSARLPCLRAGTVLRKIRMENYQKYS